MLIDRTYDSHRAIWLALREPLAKSAFRNPIGDIYEPLPTATRIPWSQHSYRPHLEGHVHDTAARKYDIEQTFYRPRAALLLGDNRLSYVWSSPVIALQSEADLNWKTAHHRFYEHLRDFLAILK